MREPSDVDNALDRLEVRTELAAVETLAGGDSGAATYRVRFKSGAVSAAVLKLTPRSALSSAVLRAERESHFYQQLASRLPLKTPALLAPPVADEWGLALLLEDFAPAPRPRAWPKELFRAVAANVATLHGAISGSDVSALGWLRPLEPTTQEQIQSAAARWQHLHADPNLRSLVTADILTTVEAALADVATLDALIASQPVLCHGDCHTGNVVLDPRGGPILIDWQELGPAAAATDLSFLHQRAQMAGADVPTAEILQAYMTTAGGNTQDLEEFELAMDAHELHTTLLSWPYYFQFASRGAQARRIERLSNLAKRLTRS